MSKSIKFIPNKDDIEMGIPKDPCGCALALCVRRTLGELGYNVTYVEAGSHSCSVWVVIDGEYKANWWSWADDGQVIVPYHRNPSIFMNHFDTDKTKVESGKWEFKYHLSEIVKVNGRYN